MVIRDSDLKDIIEQFSSLIRHVITRNVFRSDEVDLEDIEQEVRIKIWKILKKGKKVEKLPSYIKRVAYTVTVDELRKMKKQNPYGEQDQMKNLYFSESPSSPAKLAELPDFLFEQKEQSISLKELVDSLSQNRKNVLRLYLAGMDVEEISEFFKWDKTKVRHFLYRGIDEIKKKLQDTRR